MYLLSSALFLHTNWHIGMDFSSVLLAVTSNGVPPVTTTTIQVASPQSYTTSNPPLNLWLLHSPRRALPLASNQYPTKDVVTDLFLLHRAGEGRLSTSRRRESQKRLICLNILK